MKEAAAVSAMNKYPFHLTLTDNVNDYVIENLEEVICKRNILLNQKFISKLTNEVIIDLPVNCFQLKFSKQTVVHSGLIGFLLCFMFCGLL